MFKTYKAVGTTKRINAVFFPMIFRNRMIKYTISHITEKEVAEKVGIFSKLFKDNTDMLASPAAGRTIDISEVADPTFAEGILGQGIAIIPSDDTVYSPCDGTIDLMFDTGHAVNLISDKGTEILIHIGLETVSLKGKHFKTFMNTGDKVKKGDKLIEFDRQAIADEGFNTVIPIVICNSDAYDDIKPEIGRDVMPGDPIITLKEPKTK